MWHTTGGGGGSNPVAGFIEPGLPHIESPTSKRRFRNLVEVSGLLKLLRPIEVRLATSSELLRVHTPSYLARLADLSGCEGGQAGEKAPFGPGSYEIAKLAAGGCLAAADAVLSGDVDNAYALVRPPGHHAEPDRGRGFCILANAALTVTHLRAARGVRRIALIDWDAHHGNGAQDLFYQDPDVLTISVHEADNYPPGSGKLKERGAGSGYGTNINLPLPPGSGHGAYIATISEVVCPALDRFRPEMIMISSGYDACLYDPLARQMAMMETFREMTRLIVDRAAALCDGRLLVIHEGGYSEFYVPFCGLAVIEQLAGCRTTVEDPFAAHFSREAQKLQPHQAEVIRSGAILASEVPGP